MSALRLCGLTLAVVAIHLVAWRIAAGGTAAAVHVRAGVHWIATGASARAIVAAAAAATPAPPPREPPDAAPDTPTPAPRRPIPAGPTTRASAHAHRRPPGATPTQAAPAEPPPISAAVRPGDDGVARHAPAHEPPPAIYATRAPPSTSLRYALVQGDARSPAATRGSAAIDWTHDAATFTLRVATSPAHQPAREWVSSGTFDAAGVAPIRLAERERGRDKRALNIDRDGGRVRFSGATQALPLAPGAQDRWSWIAQLAAIAEAAATAPRDRGGGSAADARHAPARRIAVGTTWAFEVAGLRGELERWVFRVAPGTVLPGEAGVATRNGSSDPGDRAPALLHVVRDPERPYDLRIEAWLSPALHHLPIGLRMSTPPGGWSLALWPPATGDDGAGVAPSGADAASP